MTAPARTHPTQAAAAVEAFLCDKDWQKSAATYGWQITQRGPLTLLVSLVAPEGPGAMSETYLLRLECDFYPSSPPDARFVNPATEEYNPATDCRHLPVLEAPDCWVHPVYNYQMPYPYGPQLVCSSMTLGYYFSGHNPPEHQRWDPQRDNIGRTIYTIYRALRSPHYKGRQS